MTENEISYLVRGAIFDTYNELGPGLFEKVYEKVLMNKLIKKGLFVESQVELPIVTEDLQIDSAYRIDLLVNKKVILEIKSVESIHDVHHKQLLTYLKLSKLKLGLLVNFDTEDITKSIYRKVNGL